MMTRLSLRDVVSRVLPPRPWSEGDNIPWNDPDFSERMLREHLSQSHDLASRRLSIVEAHVDWIHSEVLGEDPSRILDLGCGPGLYSHRLARLGHRCTGIDFSPASIEYARREAPTSCDFVLGDLRQVELPAHQDLVLLNYGQFNVFPRSEAGSLLARARNALRDGGQLLLEVQTEAQVRSAMGAPPSWHTADGGLFGDGPHLVLHERFWDEERHCATERWYVVDASSAAVTRFALSTESYSRSQLAGMLRGAGFGVVEFFEQFGGSPPDSSMHGARAVR